MCRGIWTLVAVVALTAIACRPDELALRYRFPADSSKSYRLTAVARADWAVAGESGRGSYRVSFDVEETVVSSDGSTAVVEVTMTPTQIVERGLPSPGEGRRVFSVRLGRSGEVIEVLEVDGVPASALEADQLMFIGTYRPPLPLGPAGLKDEWRSQQEIALVNVSQQLTTLGSLERLGRDERGRFAELLYEGRGPLRWTTELPHGEANLDGLSTTSVSATFDLDEGALRTSSSRTRGDFSVRILSRTGRAPITGELQLDLRQELTGA